MNNFDFIIIGGGLSGSILGYLLKKQDKKVLIIEQKDIKLKSKLCGGILTEKSYKLLKEIYADKIENINFKDFNRCFINNSDNKIYVNRKLYTVFRKELDDFVISEYLSIGGTLLDKTTYTSLDIKNNQIIVNNQKYTFNYLVGADGVFSKVRKDLTNKKQKINFALENYLSDSNYKDLEIFFIGKLKSYSWIIPNSSNVIVGIGNVSGKIKIQDDYNKFLKRENIKIEDNKGAFLPTGNDLLLEYNNSVKFIGDAGGLISPITGEGIYYAITSAMILSKDVNNYKSNMKSVVSKIDRERRFKFFVYNHKIRNFMFRRSNNKMFERLINWFIDLIL